MTYYDENSSESSPSSVSSILFAFLILAVVFWAVSANPHHWLVLVVLILGKLGESMGNRFPRMGFALDALSVEWDAQSGKWDSLSGWQRGVAIGG